MKPPGRGRYDYAPVTRRPPFRWPQGEGLAVHVAVNLEHFAFGAGLGAELAPGGPRPDVLNDAWRDDGNRVGVWRLIVLLDQLRLPASVLVNTGLVDYCPEVIAAFRARGDEIVARGRSNSGRHGVLAEAALIAETTAAIPAAEGQAPAGWLGRCPRWREGATIGAHGDAATGPGAHVAAADETGDEGGAGMIEHLPRRGRLRDAPAVHRHHQAGERERLVLALRDVDERDAQLALEALPPVAHRGAQERVELGDPAGWAFHRHPAAMAAGPVRHHQQGHDPATWIARSSFVAPTRHAAGASRTCHAAHAAGPFAPTATAS